MATATTLSAARTGLLNHPFGDAYAAKSGPLPGAAEAWVDGLRQSARAILDSRGLPGANDESWRYTPLADVAKIPFIPAIAADDIDIAVLPTSVPRLENTVRIVMVNGVIRRDLSDNFGAEAGLMIAPLRDALHGDSAARTLAGRVAPASNLPMAALNAAFMAEGIVIALTAQANARVHLVSIGAAGGEPLAFHPRIIISAGDGAHLTVAVSHVGLPGQTYFSNPVTEIAVGRDASVRHFVDLAEDDDAVHAGVTSVRLDAGAEYEDFRLSLGGGKVRQDLTVQFAGRGAKAQIRGAYALRRSQHHDLTTAIDHAVPGCASTQDIRGVVSGRSHAVFQGRIVVARDAQGSDARQQHKALFLNAGPRIDCKPELEIFADDVQCAHGAASGEIDQDHLFYLMSRGIPPETARALLVEGFLNDVVGGLADNPVRQLYGAKIAAWLKTRVTSS